MNANSFALFVACAWYIVVSQGYQGQDVAFSDTSHVFATARLSRPRRMLAAATCGNYTLFAGGFDGSQDCDEVDVFLNGTLIRTDHLSVARGLMAAVTVADLIIFAGGQTTTGNKTAAVDIFNTTSQKWHVSRLSQARSMLAAATVGESSSASVVMFAGGELREAEGNTSKTDDSARVDIFDATTGVWSIGEDLCIPRKKLSAAPAGIDGIIFAGGYLSGGGGSRAEWDLFNATLRKWIRGNLSASRMRTQAASIGGRYTTILSGMGDDCGAFCSQVDVYDSHKGTWSTPTQLQLDRGRYEFGAVALPKCTLGGERTKQNGNKVEYSSYTTVKNQGNGALIVTGGKQNASTWDLVELFLFSSDGVSSSKRERARSISSEARSYMASVLHPVFLPTRGDMTATAIVGGGDFQNGTTTDFVEMLVC